MRKIFIVAAERSGDDLGAGLITALKKADKTIQIEGIGGQAMTAVGVPSQMDIEGLSILGFVEGLKHYPMILRKVSESCEAIIASKADAVILIDSWGFMIRVAKKLRKLGYSGKIIKYVAPQVWAMRSGRSKVLARHVDLLLSIQPMDKPYFDRHGLDTVYVGNPVFDETYSDGNAENINHVLNQSEGQILSVWFGSRPSEITQLSQDFIEAVKLVQLHNPDIRIVSAIAQSVISDVKSSLASASMDQNIILFGEEAKKDVMAASTVALACSGTVTTQLASAGVPTVVAYRLNSLTYWVAKRLFKPSFISIVNIAANRSLMPEFVQDDVTPENLAKSLNVYLSDSEKREVSSRALLSQTDEMGARADHRSNEKAAKAILAALK